MNSDSWKFLICTGLYFFLCGVEYAVILPTINGFLRTMNGETYFLGIIMSAFSFAGIIASPIFGRITDLNDSAKLCIIAGNLFEIVGNFLYFASTNKYMILGSRLIAGIGSGAASSILGIASKRTAVANRTKIFSLLMSTRQIGLVIGPGFNIFFQKLNYKIGHLFILNEYTAPGLLMVLLWALHTVLIMVIYKDYSAVLVTEDTVDNSAGRSKATEVEEKNYYTAETVEPSRLKSFTREFLKEEVIVCLVMAFLIMFVQTGLETALTPMTLMFFNWGGFENSILYCVCGVTLILALVVLSFLSKRISDRVFLITGLFGLIIVYVTFLIYVIELNRVGGTPDWLFPVFCVDVLLLLITIPFAWIPQASLFSKVTSKESQAFNQGIRLGFMGFGQILGPLWAGSLATPVHLPIMISVDIALLTIATLMAIMSYKYLTPRHPLNNEIVQGNGETTPLLKGSDEPINV